MKCSPSSARRNVGRSRIGTAARWYSISSTGTVATTNTMPATTYGNDLSML